MGDEDHLKVLNETPGGGGGGGLAVAATKDMCEEGGPRLCNMGIKEYGPEGTSFWGCDQDGGKNFDLWGKGGGDYPIHHAHTIHYEIVPASSHREQKKVDRPHPTPM